MQAFIPCEIQFHYIFATDFIATHMKGNIGFVFLATIAAAMLLLASCRRDPSPAAGWSYSLVQSQVADSGYTYTYGYDSAGRQIRSQTDTMVTTYGYSPGAVVRTVSLAGSVFITDYATGASGRALSDSRGYTYTYDTAGYLTGRYYASAGSYDSVSYTVSGGNVDSTVERQGDAQTSTTTTTSYTYLGTKDSRNFGLSYLGTPNVNLIATKNIYQVLNGTSYSASYIYYYQYDGRGRVSTQDIYDGSAGYITSYKYF